MARRLRVRIVAEDAADGSELYVWEEAPDTDLVDRRYEDMHPWRCMFCNQPQEPEWHRCIVCGRLREECED